MSRSKHPDPDLEKLVRSLERQGWNVARGKKYFKARCPCSMGHRKSIHLTPGRRYMLNLRKHLARESCWEDNL